ncbi:MAG: hypothetical protein ABIL14_07210 [candidate division WOR-3 bacterium]
MNCTKVLLLIVTAGALITRCAKNEKAEVEEFLDRCWFIGGEARTSDDSTTTPQGSIGGPGLALDTFPFYVKWVRRIERPDTTRHYEIDVIGDSAFVTMTAYFKGTPPEYGIFVVSDSPVGSGLVMVREITDSVVRKIKCYRNDTGWHLVSMTVADIYTVGTEHPVTITRIEVRVGGILVFTVNDPNTYFTKEQLPAFKPNDTVEVTVYCQAEGDSTWAFLHHGAEHRPGVGLKRHWRQPFYRDNTTTFKRTWIIADDSVLVTPAVRYSAIDVLGHIFYSASKMLT